MHTQLAVIGRRILGPSLTTTLASRVYGHSNFTQRRVFSVYSADATSFIPTENPVLDVADIAARFCGSVARNNVHDIRASYHALFPRDGSIDASIRNLVESSKLVDSINILASAEPHAWTVDLMTQILSDLEKHFGYDIDTRVHDAILEGYLQRDDVRGAHQWLLDLPSKPGRCKPTHEQWSKVLSHSASSHDTYVTQSVLHILRQSGIVAMSSLYESIFHDFHYRKDHPPSEFISALIDEMRKDELTSVPSLEAFLQVANANVGHTDATEVALTQQSPLQSNRARGVKTVPGAFSDINDDDLVNIVSTRGFEAAVRRYKKLRSRGLTPTLRTFMRLVRNVAEPSGITRWESVLNIKANAAIWSRVIYNAIQKGHLPVALAAYRKALDVGVRPTSAMIHPILRSLCSGFLHPPTEATIDRAYAMFQDFIRIQDENPSDASQDSGPDGPVYNTLLRALSSSKNTAKYYPIAVSLLEDMQARNVPMDCMTTASFTIIFMRLSSNSEDAFQVYNTICRQNAHKWKLDAEGYVAVLNAYCDLTVKLTGYPNARRFMEIVKDMRMAGHPVTPKVYTIILQQLGVVGTKAAKAGREDLELGQLVRRIHNHITVDASLSPDVALWNQLMDTYQRCGCYNEALLVWDSLFLSRQNDGASLSIILDTCGFAGSIEVADRIWTRMKMEKYPLNIRHWNNWLECLCRLRRIEDAVKVICVEMGRDGNCAPDVESVRIVLKFAINMRKDTYVRSQIRHHYPQLWKELPRELRSGKMPYADSSTIHNKDTKQ